MATTQASTLYGGSLSEALIYGIDQGLGLEFAEHIKTEVMVDGKPRQLTRAKSGGNPIRQNVKNPRAADFVGAAGVVIDGRQLSVTPMMVPDEIDVTDWKLTFPRFQPTGLNIDLKANPEIQAEVFKRILEATKTQLTVLHCQGDKDLADTDPKSFYDGFIKLMLADADVEKVGTSGALDANNIAAEVYGLRNSVDPRLRYSPDLKIFMSFKAYDLWDFYRRTSQTYVPDSDIKGSGVIEQSNGGRIIAVPISGLPDDFMFTTIASKSDNSNLVQGVWLEDDLDALKLYREVEVDQIWRILLRFDMGVQYKAGEDIKYRWTDTPSV